MHPKSSRSIVLGLLVACLAGSAGVVARRPEAQQAPATAVSAAATAAVVDLVALDATGKPVLDLTPAELVITVSGQPRPVTDLRYVYRGAGSELAARGGLTAVPAAAVPARVVAVMVDENAIRRGREKAVASAAWRVIDSLTPSDLVGVMTLPVPRGQTTLMSDRGPLRGKLNGLSGRVQSEDFAAAAAMAPPTTPTPSTPEEVTGPDQVEAQRAAQVRERLSESDASAGVGTTATSPTQPGSTSATGAQPSRLWQSFRTLRLALEEFRKMPGEKFMVLVTGGDGNRTELERNEREDPGEVIDAAALARVHVHVVLAADSGRARVSPPLERLARETGGAVTVLAAKKPDLGDLTTAFSSGYVAEFEPTDADRPGRVSSLSVQTTRKGVRLIAATRWSLRGDPLPEPPPPAAPTASTTSAAPGDLPPTPGAAPVVTPRKESRSGREAAPDPELEAVLARVSRYVDTYLTEFGSVVAQEEYQQTVRRGASVTETRRTKADLLLVRAEDGWVPYRDVFELNGKPVRDREERLKKLFLENPKGALEEGRRISDESARYNLGRVYRTINTPTVALSFFQSKFLPTFTFKRRGTDTIDGVKVWRIDYREVGRPTQIVHGTTGENMPSNGAIYVEPTSGRVVRTVLQNGDASTIVEMVVNFRPNDTLGLWTPLQMQERYWSPGSRGETISSDANYSGFRRFQVDTDEAMGQPK